MVACTPLQALIKSPCFSSAGFFFFFFFFFLWRGVGWRHRTELYDDDLAGFLLLVAGVFSGRGATAQLEGEQVNTEVISFTISIHPILLFKINKLYKNVNRMNTFNQNFYILANENTL